ncbi:MAG: CotH kinase family protein [Bacteroidota bacterium]
MRALLLLFALAGAVLPAASAADPSDPVYLDSVIAVVGISIHPDSLAAILDPANAESDHEYPAHFTFQNGVLRDSFPNVGFRLRGNTSRFSRKKSFKVSLNTFYSGRNYRGLEKLNLNGEHNDPTILRAKLSWDLFAAHGTAASRASHARLFINGVYYGLYTSVEHVDENFVLRRFGNNGGNLYKCLWPADLVYLGDDPSLYKLTSGNRRVYELKTNESQDDYSDLARLIGVLHRTPPGDFPLEIQRVFNVNGFLRSLAVDIATGSWDDYWYLKNNYYLYHNTASDRFEFIPYDFDNTFGIWWDGIAPGMDWGTRHIYNWGHPTEPRPLTARILEIPTFRNRLSFYIRRLLQRHFREDLLFPRIDALHTLITPAAEADSFRTLDYGYTVADFHRSFTEPLGGHVPYGLKPFIVTRRASALTQLVSPNVAPLLSDLEHVPRAPAPGRPVTVRVRVEDEETPSALLHWRAGGAWQTPLPLRDDGLNGDGEAGDEVYGAVLAGFPAGSLVDYWVAAQDSQLMQSAEPADAPSGYRSFRVGGTPPRLFINEFMAANDTTIADPFGEYEDWIEIFNGDTAAVWLGNTYLTDNFSNPGKWRFPDTTIEGGAFLLVWADEDAQQGPLHAGFKLNRDGERIGLYRGDSLGMGVVDSVSFGYQQDDVSFGRLPDGGTWQVMGAATPGFSNTATAAGEHPPLPPQRASLSPPYPNPFNASTVITYSLPRRAHVHLAIYDILGRVVETLREGEEEGGRGRAVWNVPHAAGGIYFCRLQAGGELRTAKLVLVR